MYYKIFFHHTQPLSTVSSQTGDDAEAVHTASGWRSRFLRSWSCIESSCLFIGSRRPSLASVHSTSSSVRSYSMMRFEKETQQKEIRQEMKLRLARLQQQQHLTQNKPQIVIGEALMQHGALSRVTMATPSPLTPNSLDELLPSLDENQEVSYETWKQ